MAIIRYVLAFYIGLLKNLMLLVKCKDSESIFLGDPYCYRQALSQEAIYFVNDSYHHRKDITYKQVTCHSTRKNQFCIDFEVVHSSSCKYSDHITSLNDFKNQKKSFFIRCPLFAEFSRKYFKYNIRARAFRNSSIIDESYQKVISVMSLCYCNWTDIMPKTSFISRVAEPSTVENVTLKLDFKHTDNFNLKLKLFLKNDSSQKAICEKDTTRIIWRSKTILCHVPNLEGCEAYSIVLNLTSEICYHEFTKKIPIRLKDEFEISDLNKCSIKHEAYKRLNIWFVAISVSVVVVLIITISIICIIQKRRRKRSVAAILDDSTVAMFDCFTGTSLNPVYSIFTDSQNEEEYFNQAYETDMSNDISSR